MAKAKKKKVAVKKKSTARKKVVAKKKAPAKKKVATKKKTVAKKKSVAKKKAPVTKRKPYERKTVTAKEPEKEMMLLEMRLAETEVRVLVTEKERAAIVEAHLMPPQMENAKANLDLETLALKEDTEKQIKDLEAALAERDEEIRELRTYLTKKEEEISNYAHNAKIGNKKLAENDKEIKKLKKRIGQLMDAEQEREPEPDTAESKSDKEEENSATKTDSPEYSEAEIKEAFKQALDLGKKAELKSLLREFNAKKISELSSDDYGAFYNKVMDLMDGSEENDEDTSEEESGVDIEDIKRCFQALMEDNKEGLKGVLKKYGAKKISELKEEDYSDIVKDLNDLAKKSNAKSSPKEGSITREDLRKLLLTKRKEGKKPALKKLLKEEGFDTASDITEDRYDDMYEKIEKV